MAVRASAPEDPNRSMDATATGFVSDQLRARRPDLDVDGYEAFLSDAFARFGKEGMRLPLWPHIPILRAQKPALPLLSLVCWKLRRQLLSSNDLILEFGVWKGRSINWIARHFPERTVYGFDSFRGFPDDGRSDWQQNFSVAGKPAVLPNVRLIEGYFSYTLPSFVGLLQPRQKVGLLHIDCDIYSSAHDVFRRLGPHIGPGTVIVFDELINYAGFADNEMLALYELLTAKGLSFEWFARVGRSPTLPPQVSMRQMRGRGFYQNVAIKLIAMAPPSRA